MTTYISDELRTQVKQRAGERCEYCLMPDRIRAKRHEVDHVYAEKHSGTTDLANLCLSCHYCNRYKGSDLCSLDPQTGEIVRLFHPRRDRWQEHFKLNGALIIGQTPIGRVTVELLRMNLSERQIERQMLIGTGRYPLR